jgi:hypothetical protein
MKNLLTKGLTCPKFIEKLFPQLQEICANMLAQRGLGIKNRNFWGFPWAKRSQKLFLNCGVQGCRKISD